MALNQTIRGRYGATITEAAIVRERNQVFRDRVNGSDWDLVDADEPAEHPAPGWNDPQNKLNKNLLWELAGPPNSGLGTDDELRHHLLRELGNRERVWNLMQAAVAAVTGGTTTPFMTGPLAAANAEGCTNASGDSIDLAELMRILHMYGRRNPYAPRPVDQITPDDYFYTTEEEVAVEIRRRVHELAAGINWEGNVTGGREKKKWVWNRYGLYCGCG